MNEPEKPKKGWGWMSWAVVALVSGLVALLVPVIHNMVVDLAFRNALSTKGREVIRTFKSFASDYGSRYPDRLGNPTSSNQVFRNLILDEYVASENIFGGVNSPYVEDGIIGEAPDFKEAVLSGENHWVVLGGLGTFIHPSHPLIYENAIDAGWPPKWKPMSANQFIRGRTWRGDKILVGLNDGSISVVKTRLVNETLTLPEPMLLSYDGKPWDDIKILDIEEKK